MNLITEKKAAELLATPQSTLRYWRSQGQGRGPDFVRLGGRIKYDVAVLERYVDQHRHSFSVQAQGGSHGTVQAAR